MKTSRLELTRLSTLERNDFKTICSVSSGEFNCRRKNRKKRRTEALVVCALVQGLLFLLSSLGQLFCHVTFCIGQALSELHFSISCEHFKNEKAQINPLWIHFSPLKNFTGQNPFGKRNKKK